MMDRRLVACVVAVALMAPCAANHARAAILPAAALFADAQAKERAVRRALSEPRPIPAVLKAVRTVIAEYESVVRHYPATVYCDDALWNAAQLSLEAYRRFGVSQDHTAARRLFKRLSAEYPTSPWARQAQNHAGAVSTAATVKPLAQVGPEPPSALPLERVDAGKSQDSLAARESVTQPTRAIEESPAVAPTVARAVNATAPPLSESATSSVVAPANILSTAVGLSSAAASGAAEGSASAIITRIDRSTLVDVVRLTIWISTEVTYREERLTGPPRVFFDFLGTRAAQTLVDRTLRFDADNDIIRVVRIGRHPNQTTRVVLDTAGAAACSATPLYNPYRLVIDCVRAVGAASAKAATGGQPVATAGLGAVATTTTPGATGGPEPALGTSAPPRAPPPPSPLEARPRAPLMAQLPGRTILRARTSTPLFQDGLPNGRPPIERAALVAPEREARVVKTETPADPPLLPPPVPGPASAPPPLPPAGNLSGGYSMARQLGLSVSRIVIDPGHGGHDPGAKGAGITEAALVLDIALRLEQLLKQVPGTEVILTRRDDVFVPLEERTAIANREGADLFLSIHANASSTGHVGGVETYFLNFATTRQAAAVAARENAASGQPMNALPDFVKAIALNNKVAESRDFATEVQRTLVQRLRPTNQSVRDLGVKQAPFVVLIGAAMPSVLAEVAFVTNEQEARLLRGTPYRQKIAEALSAAIRKYQASLTGGSRATQQQP